MNYADEKRNEERVTCGEDYLYSSASAGAKINCHLKNISATGACISSDAPLKIGENILLHICREEDTSFKATIVWKKQDSYGVVLNLETPDDFDKISDMLNNFNLTE